MEDIQIVEIEDPVYEETYTAHIQKNGSMWIGWVPEVPKVKILIKDLHQALEAEQEAWEKQFEENVKAGHLDCLSEKAVKNFREGRYYKVEKLQELIKK